jgi:hypothetical protein
MKHYLALFLTLLLAACNQTPVTPTDKGSTPEPGNGAPPASPTAPAPLPAPTGKVLWVSPNGSDEASSGTEASPFKTLAYACSRVQANEAIRLTAGEFKENAQCILRSGVRVSGSGATGTNRTVVYAPQSWDYSNAGVSDDPAGYLFKAESVQNVTVDGLELHGNSHKANGAVLVKGSQNVMLRDVSVYDFRLYGIKTESSSKLDVQNIYIENSGLEWFKNTIAEFPAGGSLGNLGVFDVQDSLFGFIKIKTTDLYGYGVKAASLERVTFTNLETDLYPYQSWNAVGTPGGGNFSMEIHGGHAKEVEISHSRFDATLSLMGGNEPSYADVPYTVHVHHNLFDQKNNTYGIEVGTDKMVVDHNWFKNTWTAMQNFGDEGTRIHDLTVFNNVTENISMRLVGLKGNVENLRVFNNTAVLSEGGGQNYLVTLGSNNNSKNWLLANNIVTGSSSNPSLSRQFVVAYQSTTAPQSVLAHHNVYQDINLGITINDDVTNPAEWGNVYRNNLQANPQLSNFQPNASSPVVNVADAAVGVRVGFVDAGRDVGAFEYGETPWQYGLGSVNDIEYLWAPTTSVKSGFFTDSVTVDLNAKAGEEIRYTLGGNEPGVTSTLYTAPLTITQNAKLRARTFKNGFGSATALVLDLEKGVRGYPNLAANSTATASSVYPERDSSGELAYDPKRVLDGITFSWLGWSPAAGDARPWLQVDLGAPARIRFLELYTRAAIDSSETRRNFEVRASNDPTFSSYVVLASQGGTPLPHQGVFEAEVTNAAKYRYVRVAKTVDEGFFITELRVLGER